MKIAVMQPYLFPYIGYFQLINSVDKFIIYDDVNFIKQGWINRNNILVNNSSYLFSVPLAGQSSFDKIVSIKINSKLYSQWLRKTLKTIEQAYGKAPFFNDVFTIILNTFNGGDHENIANLAFKSLKEVCNYIGISTKFERSSLLYNNQNLSAENRLIDICTIENANHYINPIGGVGLYSKNIFLENNIELSFIKAGDIKYKQFNNDFLPNLSIIDVLMFNNKEIVKQFLNEYELI